MHPEQLGALQRGLADRYDLGEEIGRGGMAIVFRARDHRHDRHVAIKVLLPELAAAIGNDRFLREIQVAAQLDHPHIIPLLDSGTAGALPYYVMPLVDGITLAERLNRDRQLPIDEAVAIAIEVADAVGHANEHGILHRDIKPGNILLSGRHARVADFGVARALGAAGADRLTQTGFVVGTPAYMSPEQAFGETDAGPSADVFSIGVVLYEMLSGSLPFVGATPQAVLARSLEGRVPSLRAVRDTISEPLEQVVTKALAKNPADRFPSARSLGEALERCRPTPIFVGSPAQTTAARFAPPRLDPTRSIAVLPFANMSPDPDNEYFSDGITEELLHVLAHVPGLQVTARTSSFAFKGKNLDVREIGASLGVGMVLEGSVRRAGNRLRITAQLIDTSRGHHLWSERYDRALDDVFEIQDQITAAIRDAIEPHLQGRSIGSPRPIGSTDPETYQLYLRAKYYLGQSMTRAREAEALLLRATQRDPGFALAHYGLAGAVGGELFLGVAAPRVGWPAVYAHAERALELDPTLGGAHGWIGTGALFFDRDWAKADLHLQRAVALSPNESGDYGMLGYLRASQGRFDEAIQATDHGVSLDALNLGNYIAATAVRTLAREWGSARAAAERMIELDPKFFEGHHWKGYIDLVEGRYEEALASLAIALELSGRWPWAVAKFGWALAKLNRTTEAWECHEELVRRSATEPIPPIAMATVPLHTGDVDGFFRWTERALEFPDLWLTMLRFEAAFDPARSDPRFAALVARAGCPEIPSVASPSDT